jgi:hypothetical protein
MTRQWGLPFTANLDRVHARRPPRGILLDMDSSVSPTYGEQEMSVWNDHYECTCYHPLFVFNQFGDLERCALRPGNVHSADGWENVLKPVVARYRGKFSRIYFRADAGFANPDVYDFLEAERIKYAIRSPANRILQERIGHLLTRPVGRLTNEVRCSYANFTYQAGSWTKPRRVVAKVEWHSGDLYPRVGFIVTNMARPAEAPSPFTTSAAPASNGSRKEKARSSGRGCHAAVSLPTIPNRGFLQGDISLVGLHYLQQIKDRNLNAGIQSRQFPAHACDGEPIKDWSLTSLKEKLIKIGAKIVSHGRYVAFQMAEVAIPRNVFADIL